MKLIFIFTENMHLHNTVLARIQLNMKISSFPHSSLVGVWLGRTLFLFNNLLAIQNSNRKSLAFRTGFGWMLWYF